MTDQLPIARPLLQVWVPVLALLDSVLPRAQGARGIRSPPQLSLAGSATPVPAKAANSKPDDPKPVHPKPDDPKPDDPKPRRGPWSHLRLGTL